MQQQIQVESEQECSNPINKVFINSSHKHQSLEIDNHNCHITRQDQIEQNISEHYQQDFDSVSSNSQQIKEQLLNIQDIYNQIVEPEGLVQVLSEINEDILRIQCDQMQDQINQLTQKIRCKMTAVQQQYRGSSHMQQIIHSIKQNQLILQDIRQSYTDFLQCKLGKQSLSVPLIIQQQEEIEEKLIEQNNKMKTLIYGLNYEISNLKRQIRKNSDILPFSQEQKRQIYVQFSRLVRQIDEKRRRQQSNGIRLLQLEDKYALLKSKFQEMGSFDLSAQNESICNLKQLESRWKEWQVKRSNQFKKNTIATHQIQNGCSAIARSILELRKQNENMNQKISHLDQKNQIIEKDCDRLMAEFNANKKQMCNNTKKRQDSNQHLAQPTPPPKKQSQIRNHIRVNLFPRPRGMSEQSSIHTNINQVIVKDKVDDETQEVLQSKKAKQSQQVTLGQSHTDNILSKPFKLKLPVKSVTKPRQKDVNFSIDANSKPSIRSTKKQNQSKLSITQRLQRIQLLQRQDKLYSQKLYQSRGRQSSYRPEVMQQSSCIITGINQVEKSQVVQKYAQNKDQIRREYEQMNTERSYRESRSLYDKTQERGEQLPARSYLRKRLVLREKKISEDYMKILLARGRRILELDNESES